MLLPIYNLNHLPTQTKPISVFQNPKPISPSLIRCSASQTAIQRIADKLRSLGFTEQNPKPKTLNPTLETTHSEGEIFIPLPNQLSKYRVGHTLDPSWSTPENPVPRPGFGRAIVRYHELSEEVKKEKEVKGREKKIKVPTLAELSLPEEELRRLRRIGIGEKRKIKVGKAGITEGIVNGVHERWRRSEVVVIVCEDLCRVNMKRTHDLLERKTGGLVVWRVGSKIVLYRGVNYTYPYFEVDNTTADVTSNDTVKDGDEHCEGDKMGSSPSGKEGLKFSGPTLSNRTHRLPLVQGVGVPNRVRFQLPGEAQLVEEADSLLEGLGPRFTDWWEYEPLPVDGDLLPAIVPGFKKPFRLLPYGIKSTLTNDEMTTLKRLGRPLPCHFALGRNRNLQGLATSIIKLWERCEIAKIAVKRGVQNTNSEMMAEELKRLTGGTLLSRDREFIVLYRGKDFLPSAASSAIKERRKLAFNVDRDRRDDSMSGEGEKEAEDVVDGTRVSACQDEVPGNSDHSYDLFKQRKLELTEAATKRTSIRLSMALEKKAKAEKLLAEIEKSAIPKQPETDKEGITEEERYMLRKVGLKMKPFLLLGRRGVFDGTIENMHLHWKYRELVKIICKERSFKTVHEVARSLEAESGGILVAVEKVSKGHAIIVYRGKNYQRPACLRPRTLLSKREAMKRSLEAQRYKSLKLHVLKLTRDIDDLKQKLAKDEEVCMQSSNEVKEEMIGTEPATHVRSIPELDSDNNSSSAVPTNCKDNLALSNGNRIGGSELESLPGSLGKESHASVDYVQPDEQTSQANPSLQSTERGTHPHDSAEHCLPGNENLRTTVESSITEPEESTSVSTKKENNTSSRAIRLSNKDRLMLRKQALKMKKRPVLAVGRSNIVTGVAKTIRTHFKKYPLAIVNVKGRAKGTSVQEVVFQLEQATGGVLVSQEPSKVILYRGWGAFDEPAKKNASDLSLQLPVSPDLMAAIQVECGLQDNQERKQTSSTES